MNSIKKKIFIGGMVLCLLFSSGIVFGEKLVTPDPKDLMEKMDKTNCGYTDQEMEVRMVVGDKKYEFTMYQKGEEKRFIRFRSSEMKDMTTLVEDANNVYVYLPGYKKVRRVAVHAMNQTFAGSDFSFDDMATAKWGPICNVSYEKEDAENWYLRCVPKDTTKGGYTYAIIGVAKDDYRQTRIEYFDNKNDSIKVLEAKQPIMFPSGVRRNSIITMTDSRTGHQTRLEILNFKSNQGLKDDMFTVRQLQWNR